MQQTRDQDQRVSERVGDRSVLERSALNQSAPERSDYEAIVIGAGLAGCSCAIQLAQAGHRVLLLEQQTYPVHRLCGEFLSIEVMATLERLGLGQAVQEVGAQPIDRVLLTTVNGARFESQLPGVALGLSRYQLDWLLLERARSVGAECREGTVVQVVAGDLASGFVVTTPRQAFTSRCVITAHGKRSLLDRPRAPGQNTSPLVGQKAHYRPLGGPASGVGRANGGDRTGGLEPGVIEIHAFPGGYCGLSAIETGEINVCWLAHEGILAAAEGDRCSTVGDRTEARPAETSPAAAIPAALRQNPALADRLASLAIVPGSGQRLRQISLALKPKFDQDLCRVGDAAGMITPLCGDGMAMALRSADLAVPLLSQFLNDRLDRPQLKRAYATAWNREFRTRLQVGRLLHAALIRPSLADWGVGLCQVFPGLGQRLIQATRGPAIAKTQP